MSLDRKTYHLVYTRTKTCRMSKIGITPRQDGTACQTCLAYPLEFEGQILE